jgi:hypothetical protein
MKKFFTQPIGSLVRQNALGFIACNVYLLSTGFELFESVDGVNRIFNFAWGIHIINDNYRKLLFSRRPSS